LGANALGACRIKRYGSLGSFAYRAISRLFRLYFTPPIVATFTHHNFEGERAKSNDFQFQSIAYSLDGGTSWEKYAQNPVIPNTEKIKDFRDPKVVWHEPSQKWILVLAAYDKVKFYGSPNLTDWEFLSDFGIEGDTRLWECPDLFSMKVEGSDEEKWVLIVSIQKDAPNDGTATSYFVGDFDGNNFLSEVETQKWLDWGTDNYAFVTWNNTPKEAGRTTGIGWMSNWQYAQIVPTEKWRSAMTLPRELKLVQSGVTYTLNSLPVAELEGLRKDAITFDAMEIVNNKALKGDFDVSQAEYLLNIDLKNSTSQTFGLKFENGLGESLTVSFDRAKGKMYVDRTNSSKDKFSDEFYNKVHSAPIDLGKDNLELQLFMDAASLEIFLNDGAVNFTDIFFPSEKFNKVTLFATEGNCNVNAATIYPLKGIWN